MAEKEQQGGAEQEKAKAEFEGMQKELGPLAQKLQEMMKDEAASPEDKMKVAQRIMEILAKFKEMMGDEAFYKNEQLVGLEDFVNKVMGSLEG